MYILEKGFSNKANIVTEDTYDHYRKLYPKLTYEEFKLTDVNTGEETFYPSKIKIGEAIHVDRRRIGSFINTSTPLKGYLISTVTRIRDNS